VKDPVVSANYLQKNGLYVHSHGTMTNSGS